MAKETKKAEDTQQDAQKPALKKATVKQSFRDKDNFDTVYPIGEEVEFTEERINDLVEKGIVEVEKPADAPAGGGGDNDPK